MLAYIPIQQCGKLSLIILELALKFQMWHCGGYQKAMLMIRNLALTHIIWTQLGDGVNLV